MKKHLVLLTVLVAMTQLGVVAVRAQLHFSAGIEIHAVSDFYDPLAASGSWVTVGSYGRCWHPQVAVGWRPYCYGHWEWTDCGWYWVSDEPWAWACYHYGSWVYDTSYGWVWIPGVEWAPAWVNWRVSDDYIGWAPCGPGAVVLAPSFFVFVDTGHFREPIRPDRVIVNNTTIINRTTVINNFTREARTFDGTRQTVVVNKGPSVDLVQRRTGARFNPVPITQAVRSTPVPSTIKQAPWREHGAPARVEPSRTVQPSRTVEPSRTSREQPQVSPQPAPEAPQSRRPEPNRPAETAPPARERPPVQAPPTPTGRELGYQKRERVAPPAAPPPAQAAQQRPPTREEGPPPERDHRRDEGRPNDKDRDRP